MALPESLDPRTLTELPWPGDITLGRLRRYMLRDPAVEATARRSGVQLLRVRLLDGEGQEYPDGLTLDELRSRDGGIRMVIDDGGGLTVEVEA